MIRRWSNKWQHAFQSGFELDAETSLHIYHLIIEREMAQSRVVGVWQMKYNNIIHSAIIVSAQSN